LALLFQEVKHKGKMHKEEETEVELLEKLKAQMSQVLVAHVCNPTYSGGGDQEDGGSKPAQASSSGELILKTLSQKIGLVEVAQGEGPDEFKPQY
jgi:hypothetical protein